jgi:hypothetical protein
MDTYTQKTNIIEANYNKMFIHLYIYVALRFLYKDLAFLMKFLWLIFFVGAIVIVSCDMQYSDERIQHYFTWIVAGWFILWVAWVMLAGIDRIIMNISLMRIYRKSQRDCKNLLEDELTDEEFGDILKDLNK